MGYGEKVIGHSGANIGTSVYMVHLPDHHFSVAVMINEMDHACSRAITKKITGNILRESDGIGTVRYVIYEFSPWVLIVGCAIVIWTIVIVFYIRKKRVLSTR
jgi:hypothetical protein